MSDRTISITENEQEIAALLYLNTFYNQIQDQVEKINAMHLTLQEKGVPFRGQGNIRPIQCKVAVTLLEEIITHLQSIYCIFHTDMYTLPIAIIIIRYRLLAPINLINEQVYQLIDLIDTFRIDCMTPSTQTRKQRENISLALDQLLTQLHSLLSQFIGTKVEARTITLDLIGLP